jgi:hypothetical protein
VTLTLAALASATCLVCLVCMAGSVAMLLGEETTSQDANVMLTLMLIFGLCAGCAALAAKLAWPT